MPVDKGRVRRACSTGKSRAQAANSELNRAVNELGAIVRDDQVLRKLHSDVVSRMKDVDRALGRLQYALKDLDRKAW